MAGTGAFEEEVRRAVVEMGVDDVVQMLGFRSYVKELLNILDVQLNASYGTEATSMALLEGMSLGLPPLPATTAATPGSSRTERTACSSPPRTARLWPTPWPG